MSLLLEKQVVPTVIKSEPRESTSKSENILKIKSQQIVIFKDKLYMVVDGGTFGTTYGIDYFTYKALFEGPYKTSKSLNEVADFSILHSNKSFRFYRGADDLRKQTTLELYEDYIKNAKVLTETDPKSIHKHHNELLKKRIFHKLLDSPPRSVVAEREKYHCKMIRDYFDKELSSMSEFIYEAAEKAHQRLLFHFSTLEEDDITHYKKLPAFLNYPCVDGQIRNNFRSYFFYLCSMVFTKHADEDINDQMWIGARLKEIVSTLFPYFQVTAVPQSAYLLPGIIIDMNVSEGGIIR